jgi:hypothetical protein
MTLHFAYGSNMSRAHMRARCPTATARGSGVLRGWRFSINPDGYGTLVPQPGGVVLGVLWQMRPRDLAAINAYENIAGGLYRRRMLPVAIGGRRQPALVYLARRGGEGIPRPGYVALVAAAARDWGLPERYIQSIERWSPSGWQGSRAKDTGDVG